MLNAFIFIDNVHLQHPTVNIQTIAGICRSVDFCSDGFFFRENSLSLLSKSVNFLLLKFFLLLKVLNDFLFPSNFILDIFNLIVHANYLNVEILCTFGIMIRGILDL